ncbi:helix-turn-helix domain-containing protein [Propionibacteriaceae bacterium G1746]|uniref:helix-turn-helix domain-containing protein n=1 Tax=Aestuariimicrobium sp. G57 TaxID=3418485 RepID=UPI003C13950E
MASDLNPEPPPSEPLWRDLLGGRLRRRRYERGETLDDVAARAGVSPQYLSEIERGRKEPSSEMVQAVAGALDLTLLDLTTGIARDLTARQPLPLRRTPARSGSVSASSGLQGAGRVLALAA